MAAILIIKLGALGDFVQAVPAMQAIRRAHPDARLDLLTRAPYRGFAAAMGLFDRVRVIPPESARRISGISKWRALWKTRALLLEGDYDFVYDLQTSSRSSRYFHLMWPRRPQWCGIARGCSHPHTNPHRNQMHNRARLNEQLAGAGITVSGWGDWGWVRPELAGFALPEPYAVLLPASAPGRGQKRWDAAHFAHIAARLVARGQTPLILGAATAFEQELAATIIAQCPRCLSLVGQTDLVQLAGILQHAALVLGNDTGPTHLAAMQGVPTIALFLPGSRAALCAPSGPYVTIISADANGHLPVSTVAETLKTL